MDPVAAAPKKRGRKPKGGKIIVPDVEETKIAPIVEEQNIIVHLKCSTKDLEELSHFEQFSTVYDPTFNEEKLDSYDFNDNKYDNFVAVDPNKAKQQQNTHQSQPSMSSITGTNFIYNPFASTDPNDDGVFNNKLIWTKVKELNSNYVNNEIYNKNSSCFWCTCPFSHQPVYIPKAMVQNDSIEVYGHFCTPECATAFLFKENIDTSCKWERYHILNKMYAKAFNYKKNIKPAPDPRYLLNKFLGTLSIEEYRALLRDDKLLLVVDKPLTRVLPELYEDNNEHEDLNKNFKMNSNTSEIVVKKTIAKAKPVKAKIVAEQFAMAAN
jgi:hypothetical protein